LRPLIFRVHKLIKELSGGLLRLVLVLDERIGVLIMRFRKGKVGGYLRRLLRKG